MPRTDYAVQQQAGVEAELGHVPADGAPTPGPILRLPMTMPSHAGSMLLRPVSAPAPTPASVIEAPQPPKTPGLRGTVTISTNRQEPQWDAWAVAEDVPEADGGRSRGTVDGGLVAGAARPPHA
eukprot:jgi/Ulvmu1/890/UM100_0045.1